MSLLARSCPKPVLLRTLLLLLASLLLFAGRPRAASAQNAPYDASWYDADRPYVKVAVTQDGLHRISGEALRALGVPLGEVDRSTLRLLEKGREIPLHLETEDEGDALSPGDGLVFAGRRNRGWDEVWAYNGQPARQSSAYRSLYTDTLTYWLTWGGEAGRRYLPADAGSGGTVVRTVRDTLHLEQDRTYHYGSSSETGNPLFTEGEGYYWNSLGGSDTETYTLSLPRAAASPNEDLHLTVHLVGRTGSCHRATLEANFGSGFEAVAEQQWQRYDLAALEARVSQDRLNGSSVEVRVRTFSSGFGEDSGCDTSTPNGIFVDYVEARYTRRLAPTPEGGPFPGGQQTFTAPPSAAPATYELSGYSADTRVDVFSPATERRFTLRTGADGTARFSDAPPSDTTHYWAAAAGRYRSPAALSYQPAGSQPDWTAPDNNADYVVLTTEALRASAEALAAYRRSENGYTTAVIAVEELYDQFDYGRATPIAIRRFVHHTQRTWAANADFLTIWGDATYPIRTATAQPDAPWNVPSFGFSPSDAWFAMQYAGRSDWSEVLALGRVPVRTAAQAATFLEKLRNYETGRLSNWQKRLLVLSGGTTPAQQTRLEGYNEAWARTAARPPTGMDTLYFSKRSSDALDASFQDSLSAAFERGAGWLNYFGHSAAQTWEIVTEAPAQFANAGRLPMVVSLGCQTGAFAGGRYSEKPAPSFGEQLVLGMNPNAPRGPGSHNGAIGHFGTTYLGNIGASARLNESLTGRVFKDTMRVMGAAIREAKARVADGTYLSTLVRNHLLQYNLLGEPATRLALPDRPNLHLEPSQISARPLAPVPSDSLHLAVTLRAQGLVPGRTAGDTTRLNSVQRLADSTVTLAVSQRLPGGQTRRQRRTIRAFAVDTTVTLSFYLDDRTVGENVIRAEADYVNHPLARRPEVRTDDNAAERTKTVFGNGLRLVAPRPLGVTAATDPVFRLSLSSSSGEPQSARFQIATDSAFTDVRAEETLEASGPLVKWSPATPLEAGRTYYWRARLEPTERRDAWRSGSFTARRSASAGGWLQQAEQFDINTQSRLLRADERWRLATYETSLQVYSERGSGSSPVGFVIGGGLERYLLNGLGIGVLILDGQSGATKAVTTLCPTDIRDRYVDPPGDNVGCDGADGEAAIARLDSLVRTTLDEGDYLLARTRNLGGFPNTPFPEDVQEAFSCLGETGCSSDTPTYSQAADTLTYRDLWILQVRKGHPDQTYEQVDPAGSGENEITYQTRLPFFRAEGQTTTPRIGPAQRWDALHWTAALENAGDRLRFEVLSGDGGTVLDSAALSAAEGPSQLDLSAISAAEHPYLRLRARLADPTERTAPQLERWRVDYTPTAELALDPARLEIAPSDTLAEGQPARARAPVVNLTGVASSPVRVRFAVTDSSNQTRPAATDTLGPLPPDGEQTVGGTIATASLAGRNTLTVRAEQRRAGASGPQAVVPEALTFNNSLVESFFVQADRSAPSVDVRVAGRTLPVDPDPASNLQDPALPFVSFTPTFEITLRDNSEYLALTDTSLIEVRFGTAFDLRPVSFASEALEFIPAEEAGAPARALFSPNLRPTAQDTALNTVYTLQVDVQDTRGNQPEQSYQTHVRVKTDMTVEDLYPYPNPMSTRTDFMFRLEGSRPSAITECRMRIYTLSGQLLMDLNLLENPMLVNPERGGGLRAGWNRVPWDGRDADGDRLATGVYLYKVYMDGEGDLTVNDGGVEKIAIIR